MVWDWDYTLREVLPKLLGVLHVTIGATVAGFLLALVLGLVLALGRRSKNRILSGLAGGVVEFVRLTPLLVQLYFIYFVMPEIGLTLSAFAAGVLGLGIHYA
ncbi:MAG: ABC transporter permease subunit, partial [Planifilum fulgidum]